MADFMTSQVAWSGEKVSPRFLKWSLSARQSLKRNATPHEWRFANVVKQLRGRMNRKSGNVLRFIEQKQFVIADGIVFFADFYFKAFKVAVEIDGGQHANRTIAERDAWRTELLSAHGIHVLRYTNAEIEAMEDLEITQRLLRCLFDVPGRAFIKRTLSNGLRR